MSRRLLLVLPLLCGAAALAAFLIPTTSSASPPVLNATVGPGFTISLKHPDGSNVTRIKPGTYDVKVSDKSDLHNFHLTGPGNVDEKTQVDLVEDKTWTITFVDGTYDFQCDAHPLQMKGSFTVSSSPPPPPPPPVKPGTLKGVVGPGFTIKLKTKSGKLVRKVKAGRYKIKIRDRGTIHNFHLFGKRVNKRTGVPFVGRKTWKVRFRKGKTYRYRCDTHPTIMKGKFKAV